MRLNNKETDECEKRRPLKFGMRFRRETIEIGGDSAHKFVWPGAKHLEKEGT